MNNELRKIFETHYLANQIGPSPSGYFQWPDKMLSLFLKWNIKSFFDSGCRNRDWIQYNSFAENGIRYIGGDISESMVEFCRIKFPDLEILHHDTTTDPFPDVDLIFSSDVLIHLKNSDKLRFLQNFKNSNAKYLLMTNSDRGVENTDFVYDESKFPMAHVTWFASPWNFPKEVDSIDDGTGDSRLRLWTKEQLVPIIDIIQL